MVYWCKVHIGGGSTDPVSLGYQKRRLGWHKLSLKTKKQRLWKPLHIDTHPTPTHRHGHLSVNKNSRVNKTVEKQVGAEKWTTLMVLTYQTHQLITKMCQLNHTQDYWRRLHEGLGRPSHRCMKDKTNLPLKEGCLPAGHQAVVATACQQAWG